MVHNTVDSRYSQPGYKESLVIVNKIFYVIGRIPYTANDKNSRYNQLSL